MSGVLIKRIIVLLPLYRVCQGLKGCADRKDFLGSLARLARRCLLEAVGVLAVHLFIWFRDNKVMPAHLEHRDQRQCEAKSSMLLILFVLMMMLNMRCRARPAIKDKEAKRGRRACEATRELW